MKMYTLPLCLALLAGCGDSSAVSSSSGTTGTASTSPTGAVTLTTLPGTVTGNGSSSTDPADSSSTTGSSGSDTGEPPDDDGGDDGNAPLEPYLPCESADDCGPEQVCFDLLGVSVCTMLGCADDEGMCGAGASCMVTEAIAPDGVCVNTGADQFCARECSDVLKCNLDAECAAEGCCVAVDDDGCPDLCDDLMTIECEISPQCDASCCGR